MALLNAKVPYRSIRDAILKVMRDGKATLNEGLTLGTFQRDLEQIKSGDIAILPTKNAIFPTILVKLIGKEEDFNNLGNYGRKRPTIKFRIFVLVKNTIQSSESDNDIMQLVGNIESLFRNNIPVDTSLEILYGQPVSVEFGNTEVFENQYFDIAIIDYNCLVELR